MLEPLSSNYHWSKIMTSKNATHRGDYPNSGDRKNGYFYPAQLDLMLIKLTTQSRRLCCSANAAASTLVETRSFWYMLLT